MPDTWQFLDDEWSNRRGTKIPVDPPQPPQLWTASGLPLSGQIVTGSSNLHGLREPLQNYTQPQLGAHIDLHRMYWSRNADTSALESLIASAHANGSIPWVSFKFPGSLDQTWAATLAGNNNAWLQNLATRLGAITTGPIWLAFHHEPENDETDLPADWKAVTRYAMAYFTQYSHICKTQILAGWQGALGWGGGKWNWTDSFAGADRVDLIAMNPYNADGSDIGTVWYEWIDNFYPVLAQFAAANGVSWGLSETGITDIAFARLLGEKPNMNGNGNTWYQRQFDDMQALGGSALIYFPHTLSTNSWGWQDYPNNNKRDALAAVFDQGTPFPFA